MDRHGVVLGRPVAALVLAACTASAWAAPEVDVFTPQGQAKGVRQVAVRFTEPMIAFGDPRLPDPFAVRCDGDPERLKGRGRWADQKNWSYDFEADLPAGQACTFTVKPDFKAPDGQAIAGKREFRFHTGGPAVLTSLPREGNERVDEEQVFLLALDAPVDPASLSDAWCEAGGINERIALKLLPESQTRELLAANRAQAYYLYNVYFKGNRRFSIANFKIEDKRLRDLPVIGVRCGRRLPAGAPVSVVLGPEVKSKSGLPRETPQRLAFEVRPEFTVKLTCQRVNQEAACLPVTPIVLDFNAPVPREAAARMRLKGGGRTFEPTLEPNVNTVQSVEFRGPFPEKTRYTVDLPRDFRDDAGREPENKAAFPLATGTDESPPLVKFPGRFGILELNAGPLLPVSVRNVEATLKGQRVEVAGGASRPVAGRSVRVADDDLQIMQRYQAFRDRDEDAAARAELKRHPREGEVSAIQRSDKAAAFELPKPGGEKAFEVIGIPLPKAGFYVVELASPRLGQALHGEDKPYYVATSVLVTNLAVHFKHGRESSLVWVTTLDTGKPVAGARVTVRDCNGRLWFEGKTDAEGIAVTGDQVPAPADAPVCAHYRRDLIAFARLGEDVSFTYSTWSDGIQPWNFNLPASLHRRKPLAIHTVFDRTLFRAGETVSMKHVARAPAGAGFRIPERGELPAAVEVQHVGSGQKFKLAAMFDAKGIAEGAWKIPAEAKLGVYRLAWGRGEVQSSAEFRVEAYRVPLMRAVLAAPKAPLVKPDVAKLDAAVTYLSGGPAGGVPVKIRYRVDPRGVHFADYADFRFGGTAVKEGVQTGRVSDSWETFDPDGGDGEAAPAARAGPAASRTLVLDSAGTASVVIDKLPPIDRPASLVVEMEYNDPNGELLATSTRVALHPAALYLGIRPEGWAANKKGVRTQVVALDPLGKPLAGRAVAVEAYERKTYSSRRRLLGGFYAYDSTIETKRLGSGCSGTTDERGLMFCSLKPGASGELILVARAKDEGGREAFSTSSVWVLGDGDWWFEPSDHDRIDLIPEKKRYEPGETAKLQVRMPFREATVLVTVEREGVLSQKVVTLDGKSPVIEVPIAGSYGPNVFVSALAVRGRVDPEVPGPYAWLKRIFYRVGSWLGLVDEVPVERDTRPTALVDLSKPAYKLGMAEIKVGRRDYALTVKVAPERDTFRVRETARVAIQVSDSDGKPAANGEIALAAVDEGLLELMDNASWSILDALLGSRPVEVTTATAQGQVIGKRHFGKKAAPPGGGGGRAGARELFDTLLAWQGRVALDAQGRATVEVPLNDSLTAFRIVAVAVAGEARFGHGYATVRTTQDLMLFSGLPPVVREQDEFTAMFTLRNTTAAPLAAQLAWKMRDRPAGDAKGRDLAGATQSVQLAASEARLISVQVKAPIGVERLYWEVTATSGGASDRLRTDQKVVEVHPVRIYQATLAQLDQRLQFPVERPADAIPGRGGIRVDVMGTLAGEMSGVREYFLRYPYTCLEQRTSKAIGLGDDGLWKSVAGSAGNYLDRDGLARYFPIDWLDGSDALTAYLVQVADAAGREWPEDTLKRMLGGLEAFATGRITRGSALPTADLTFRKLAAIEALARHERARPAMLESITIDPPLWPTSALVDWIGILQRVEGIPLHDQRLKEALSLLRGRLNFQGTVMTFATERTDALWWLMVSADLNANRALLAVLEEPSWREDMGRLVRGSLSRQKRGHWGTTTANAWGVVAIARFAEAFEKTPATGSTSISLGSQSASIKVVPAKQTRDLEWPAARETLEIAHAGAGAPWTIVQSRAALPLKAPLSTGYAIKRTVAAVEQKDASGYTRGDVYRVTLEVDAQTDMTWVVIDDPIPSGAAILGSGLGRDAGSLAQGEKREGWASPAFIERTHEAYRAYYQFVPKGRFKIEYTVRLNNPGKFDLPATRVEAMYAPELFGEVPNATVRVKP
jgi:uncharacterized protein YfaS (alpha-2-macroglobulin family)